ncbi:glycosyltransferase family 39 protein [Bosea sp. 117]|uniref:glycosyltransferase family 39 protein n=1 Tax=Bosea sp. 117 TaxID=1125973 RepID=UPI000570D8B3|nr:glycosyltransferase family 39 protein [Bosea sp. 117]
MRGTIDNSVLSETASPRMDRACSVLLRTLFVVSFLHALFVMAIGTSQPLLDHHSFRQTQTAVASYWMLHGSSWIAYETPTLGAPWSAPFEFPTFQWLAAIIAWFGVPLDMAGRALSFVFFLAALWPLRILFRELRLSSESYLATAALFLASPMYLFWGRAFLIESCALFFALFWLALLARYLNQRNWRVAVAAIAMGALATTTKSTTFPAFAVLGGAGFVWAILRERQAGRPLADLARLTAACAAIALIPLAIGLVWVDYSDRLKEMNEFASHLTSKRMAWWNFGDLSQRLSRTLWIETLIERVMPELLGRLWPLAIGALVAAAFDRCNFALVAAFTIAFLLPFVTFTNLHIVHNYYQVANGLLLLIAIGIGLGTLLAGRAAPLALFALVAVTAGQIVYFQKTAMPIITWDYGNNRLWRISRVVQANTTPDQGIIIIGDPWSSVLPYYTERKTFSLAEPFPAEQVGRVFDDPGKFLGGLALGGIVYCADRLAIYTKTAPLIEEFVRGRQVLGEYEGCQFLAPTR